MSIFLKIKKGLQIGGIVLPIANTITQTIDLIHSNDEIDNKQADIVNAQAIDELNKKFEALAKRNEELEAQLHNPVRTPFTKQTF
jgi:hypothetical protein